MAETFGQRFDQHTDDIITATELMKELADREGLYVWEKYKPILPEGYTQLEYIESTGTQYIDTEFKPNQNTRVVADVLFKTVSGSSNSLFSARAAGQDREFSFNTLGDYYRTVYGTSLTNYDTSVSFTDRFIVDKNKNVLTLNGANTVTETYQEFSCPVTLYLFAQNNNGTVQFYSIARLYSCQIYDNGTLVRDFVPCKNSSGVAGLYDMVEGKFYGNAGTGSFIAGSVVKGTFEGYVVADDETSYPDGGELDGYWYEIYKQLPTQSKTVTPVPAGMTVTPDVGYLLEKVVLNGFEEGVSGIDYGIVTFTSETVSKSFNHNLGKTPRFA